MLARSLPLFLARCLLTLATLVVLAGTAGAAEIHHRYFNSSDGLRLHYLEAGSGRDTLIFVPGWLMPAAIFERQLASLSEDFRVLAFDPRSQGLSDLATGSHAPAIRLRDFDEFLAAAQVNDRYILAGWSLGVLETLDYVARRQPGNLAGMILIDNSIGAGTPPPPRKGGFFDRLADPRRRVAYLTEFCHGLFQSPPPPAMLDAVLASALRVSPAAAKQLIGQPYPRTYWYETVTGLSVPVLYAVRPRFSEQADELAAVKPAELATIRIFENTGHALFVDAADEFNAAVSLFSRQALARQ